MSSARNEGLKFASGEYLWFIDGDDYIEKSALKTLNKYLQQERYDIISFKYYKEFKKNNRIIQSDKVNINNKKQYCLVNTSACTKIFNTNFFKSNNFLFDEGRIYEDLSLIPFIMCMGKNIKFIQEILYTYTYRKDSIMNSSKTFNSNRDDKFFAIDMLYNRFRSKNIEDKYKSELEFLTIKHLLIVYSTEILSYKSRIYKNRCIKVLKYLKGINNKWYNNKYLKKRAIFTKIYVGMFRYRLFFLCKIFLLFKGVKK